MITHSRPETRPSPVIMPAPAMVSSYMPYAANWESSRNGDPVSSSARGSSIDATFCGDRDCIFGHRNVDVVDKERPVECVNNGGCERRVTLFLPQHDARRRLTRNRKLRRHAEVADAVKAGAARHVA